MVQERRISKLSEINKAFGEDQLNMHWSYLSIIALNIFEYTKAVYNKDFEKMFDSLHIVQSLASPRLKKSDSKEQDESVYRDMEWIELSMPNVIRNDGLGRPKLIDKGLQWEVTQKLRSCFKRILWILENESMLTFPVKNPGEAMGRMDSS